jgi:hypothetical protein
MYIKQQSFQPQEQNKRFVLFKQYTLHKHLQSLMQITLHVLEPVIIMNVKHKYDRLILYFNETP